MPRHFGNPVGSASRPRPGRSTALHHSTTPSLHSPILAARLHGPRDIRVERVPHPGQPGPGDVLLRVTATGICGSDLHTYVDGRIGDTVVKAPLILGHEFAGVVEKVGANAMDANGERLRRGARVAVDPGQPCQRCDLCEQGHPNLCRRMHFCGLFPDPGSLCEFMVVPARTCFPVPDTIDDESAAMLEPLTIALHAANLAKIRVGDRVAVIGAGPIGLLLIQSVRLAGAVEVYVSEPRPWRRAMAEKFGAIPLGGTRFRASNDPKRPRGSVALRNDVEVDVAIEAAWGGDAIDQAIELVRPGGRVVLVGIPSENRCAFSHSIARRKGLTVVFSRRTKHCYPRAIQLAIQQRVDLKSLVSHRFHLEKAAEAFRMNAAYKDKVVKVMIER